MVMVGQSKPSKLFELMSWVELGDGARYLSLLLGEELGREELLRLALEGHLTLSVRLLSGMPARCGAAVPLTEDRIKRIPTLDGEGWIVTVDGTVLPGGDQVIVYEDRVCTINDVWDLPMLGGDRLTVENLYEQIHWREAPELLNLEGTFVTDSSGRYCQLLERFGPNHISPDRPPNDPLNYYPAAGLPADSIIVVRPQNLRHFAQSLLGADNARDEKPLAQRERSTLLTIIAALCRLAKIDIARTSAAAAAIESQTELIGARVAARTIEEHLKRVPDALEGRGR
jgi:hypothetical protein